MRQPCLSRFDGVKTVASFSKENEVLDTQFNLRMSKAQKQRLALLAKQCGLSTQALAREVLDRAEVEQEVVYRPTVIKLPAAAPEQATMSA